MKNTQGESKNVDPNGKCVSETFLAGKTYEAVNFNGWKRKTAIHFVHSHKNRRQNANPARRKNTASYTLECEEKDGTQDNSRCSGTAFFLLKFRCDL